MTRHLICLLSRQLIPNYQTVKHYKPDVVWRIASLDSQVFDQDFRQTMSDFLPDCPRLPAIDAFVVDSHYFKPSLDAIAGLIRDRPGDEWIVNCTGGNKMMAGGALIAAQAAQRDGITVSIVYVDSDREGHVIDAVTGISTTMQDAAIPVRQYLRLFGVRVDERFEFSNPDWDDLAIQWCAGAQAARKFPFAVDHAKDPGQWNTWRREGAARNGLQPDNRFPADIWARLNQLISAGQVPNWQMRFCTGDFLEWFVLLAMRRYASHLGIEEAIRGVRDLAGAVGEVDLYVSRAGTLYVIECKSGLQQQESLTGQIGKLQAKRHRIGARNSRGLLATTGRNALEPHSENISEEARRQLERSETGLLSYTQINELAISMRDSNDARAVRILSEWMGID